MTQTDTQARPLTESGEGLTITLRDVAAAECQFAGCGLVATVEMAVSGDGESSTTACCVAHLVVNIVAAATIGFDLERWTPRPFTPTA